MATALGLLTGLFIGILISIWMKQTWGPKVPNYGERLLAHSRDRSDYRLFVALPSAKPARWVEVEEIDETSVTLRDSTVLPLSAVKAYFVTYPSDSLAVYQCFNDLIVIAWWLATARNSINSSLIVVFGVVPGICFLGGFSVAAKRAMKWPVASHCFESQSVLVWVRFSLWGLTCHS
jgi:hypothetical protein